MLQWGHGDEAVEEAGDRFAPPLVAWLQWGHGDEAVEEALVRDPKAKVSLLQWGHGDEAVEEREDRGCTSVSAHKT